MKEEIVLSADSACDIGPELARKFHVQFFPFYIEMGGQSFEDGPDFDVDGMYETYREKGVLPKTAALSPEGFTEHFRQWVEEGHEVLHLDIGSALSSAYQNSSIAAGELEKVYTVDSASLSTGFGLLVVKAGEMIARGAAMPEILAALEGYRSKTHASFILDTLEFMKAGGRCSSVAAFGANLLQLKPCIQVDNQNGGSMGVGKKYRGSMEKVLPAYVRDQLAEREDLDLDRIFITHSGSPKSDITLVKSEIRKYAHFREVHVTRASATISSHCGPRTLGILFMTE